MLLTPGTPTTRHKGALSIGWGQVSTPHPSPRTGVVVGGTTRNTDALSLLVSTSSVHPGKAAQLPTCRGL